MRVPLQYLDAVGFRQYAISYNKLTHRPRKTNYGDYFTVVGFFLLAASGFKSRLYTNWDVRLIAYSLKLLFIIKILRQSATTQVEHFYNYLFNVVIGASNFGVWNFFAFPPLIEARSANPEVLHNLFILQ